MSITLYFKANLTWNIDYEQVGFPLEISVVYEIYWCISGCLCVSSRVWQIKDATILWCFSYQVLEGSVTG